MGHKRRPYKQALLFAAVAAGLPAGAAGTMPAAPRFQPLPGVSAEPHAPRPAGEWPPLWQQCAPKRGQSHALRSRPNFPESLGNAADLAAVMDSAMCEQLKAAWIAGAAAAVVDGDRIVFSSGYGYADFTNRTPVDAGTTMFRIGSVSKLFAWTSVMQLVEQETLDLTADINDYLRGKPAIPATYPQPITLRHLLTHTSGFEENIGAIGLASTLEDLPTLEETITEHVPARVRPPSADFAHGEDAAYSNWGAALAGYIVERASHAGFDDYVDEHIFRPLGMTHSTFREPLRPEHTQHLSTGHRSEKGLPACPPEFLHGLGPASSGSASAEDMARFMRAHLRKDTADAAGILKPATLDLMQSRALSPHPQLAGGAYGFNERYINGRKLLWHGGLTECFYTEFYLFPEQRLGLFVAYNTPPMASQMGAVVQRFMDHYFPATLPSLVADPNDFARLTRVAGYYRPTSRARTTWEKVFDLTAALEVTATRNGKLLAPRTPGTDDMVAWVPVAQDVLRRQDGEETIALVESGDESYLLGPWPFAPMVKLHWWETPKFNDGFVSACGLGFLLSIVFALSQARAPECRQYRRVSWLAATAGAWNLCILAALGLALADPGDIMIALPPPLLLAMCMSIGSPLFLLAAVAAFAFDCRRPGWTPVARAGFAALIVPSAALVCWLSYWNLIGRQLG